MLFSKLICKFEKFHKELKEKEEEKFNPSKSNKANNINNPLLHYLNSKGKSMYENDDEDDDEDENDDDYDIFPRNNLDNSFSSNNRNQYFKRIKFNKRPKNNTLFKIEHHMVDSVNPNNDNVDPNDSGDSEDDVDKEMDIEINPICAVDSVDTAFAMNMNTITKEDDNAVIVVNRDETNEHFKLEKHDKQENTILNNNKVKVDKDLLEEVRSFFLGKKKKPESDIIENYNMDKTLYDDIETIERKKIQKHDNCREFNFEYK